MVSVKGNGLRYYLIKPRMAKHESNQEKVFIFYLLNDKTLKSFDSFARLTAP